jgi:hypothetical protein
MSKLFKLACATNLIPLCTSTVPALADDEPEDLRLARNAYLRHEYRQAVGLLGGIAPQEFNDATFHYYMANCMVHMHEKESAIREYRIAYALRPNTTIGRYSKQCLFLFGIDAEGKVETKKKDEKDKGKEDAKPDDGLASVTKYLSEDQRAVARNLDDLIKDKARPGSAKLQKVGTNIFVRNYKDPGGNPLSSAKDSQSSAKQPASPRSDRKSQSAQSITEQRNNSGKDGKSGGGLLAVSQL